MTLASLCMAKNSFIDDDENITQRPVYIQCTLKRAPLNTCSLKTKGCGGYKRTELGHKS